MLVFSILFAVFIASIIMTHAIAQNKKYALGKVTSGRDVSANVSVNSFTEDQEYHYASMSEPNPFVPPLLSTLMARLIIPIDSILQKYSLTDLKVVGIWTLRDLETRAMIMTPDGQGVVVKPGSFIGRRGGQVAFIDQVSVGIREFSLASDGTRMYEDEQIYIEEGEPQYHETEIIMNSDKVGLPNRFGYGKKNYMNSPTYDERHRVLERQLEKERAKLENTDETRPSFPSDNQAPSKPSSSASDVMPKLVAPNPPSPNNAPSLNNPSEGAKK